MRTIPLTQGKVALVDDADFDYLSQWKWSASQTKDGHWYAKRGWTSNGKKHSISMHRQLVQGCKVDHKDRDGLNNQRGNLRACTQSQNIANSSKHTNSSSSYKGITLYRRTMQWQAQIMVNGQNHYLGRFELPQDAASAYDVAALHFFGQFAATNASLGLL